MSNKAFRDQYREILGMEYDTDNMGGSYDDAVKVCAECGAFIDDEFIMPVEGNFYCDDCEPEEWE